ncbi:ribose ABC transporter permease protein (plasmid) [Rhizobium phaseoli]|uniref:Autoinducer 2 import system permease protein LsrD n=1 Tax=Rhizobium phaseoli TaxID=396 RepID=A0ABM6CKS6_9HYPH|nr:MULTISPECIES: ABC transporter permease [Rhizobium]EGE61339.1 ABC transporter membrane spanning protein (ribose) [Rhizobium etli CNPAF512]KEC70010.1 ribose transport system permease protein RbsC [Rhizobium leguminosarum bv. phaseoli CCGM1]AGS26473.1 ribose ABC transporter permease protein [Rhizobium etli bv. mimosae str. Mim1]ANL50907.1 ribose ABC transporter permease protein [Rhizobium phaseoli]ANL57205.1 ribose ABC transporter permease protein [Rhizobium phaseoli]
MSDITQNAAVPSSKLLGSFSVRDAGTLIGLVAIVVIFGLLAPDFLSQRNLLNILQQSSINACLALGMTLVIISGGIDLSVGPTAAISAVICATLLVAGVPVPLAILAGLGIGVLCGLVNGVLVAYAGLQPFIVTLGTLSTYRAIALIYTGGNPVLGVPQSFRTLFNGTVAGIPNSVVMVAVVALLAWVLLKKTPLGEYLLAVGGNEEAAYVAGVPIAVTKITAYVISGALAALASMILIGRLGAAEPILGNLWELDAIAAAAIGGASLMGGKGSVIGTLLGAIILGAMRNGLTLMNVQAFYQLLATGLIILVAMMIDRVTRGRG